MKGRFELWTDEETQTALRMRDAGKSGPEIGHALGRTPGAVHARFKFAALSSEEKSARYKKYRIKALEREKNDRTCRSGLFNNRSARPTDAQIEERDRRFSRERTIAQLIMGDPLPGQSALDKRMGVSNGAV